MCTKVTELWDKHLFKSGDKRKDDYEAGEQEERPKEDDQAIIDMIDRAQNQSTPVTVDPEHPPDIDDIQFSHVSRMVMPKKGKWIRINPVEETKGD